MTKFSVSAPISVTPNNCKICGYDDGIKAYCLYNPDNTISVFVKTIHARLDGGKTASGKVVYNDCCKVVEDATYDLEYQLEKKD